MLTPLRTSCAVSWFQSLSALRTNATGVAGEIVAAFDAKPGTEASLEMKKQAAAKAIMVGIQNGILIIVIKFARTIEGAPPRSLAEIGCLCQYQDEDQAEEGIATRKRPDRTSTPADFH